MSVVTFMAYCGRSAGANSTPCANSPKRQTDRGRPGPEHQIERRAQRSGAPPIRQPGIGEKYLKEDEHSEGRKHRAQTEDIRPSLRMVSHAILAARPVAPAAVAKERTILAPSTTPGSICMRSLPDSAPIVRGSQSVLRQVSWLAISAPSHLPRPFGPSGVEDAAHAYSCVGSCGQSPLFGSACPAFPFHPADHALA
jgi:hypothetical protein